MTYFLKKWETFFENNKKKVKKSKFLRIIRLICNYLYIFDNNDNFSQKVEAQK